MAPRFPNLTESGGGPGCALAGKQGDIVLRIVKTGLFGLAALAITALAIILVRGAMEAPPPIDPAPYIEKAASYDATIARDEWGVPHVFGKRDADAAFGFGYAHSEDDFATIQEVLIATRGQLASVKGQRAAVTDYLVNLMGVWQAVDARYESDLSPQVRKVIEAYADGVNYYAALHPWGSARHSDGRACHQRPHPRRGVTGPGGETPASHDAAENSFRAA